MTKALLRALAAAMAIRRATMARVVRALKQMIRAALARPDAVIPAKRCKE